MIANNNPQIDVPELLQRIHEELSECPPILSLNPAAHARTIPLLTPLSLPKQRTFIKKTAYILSDFLDYHDESFITNAYRGLLQRDPDPEGLQYFLNALRSGHYTKIDILGRLRLSTEGRSHKIPVKGLWIAFFMQSAYRLPVVGYLIAWCSGLTRLPSLLKNMQRFEAWVHHQQSLTASRVAQANENLRCIQRHMDDTRDQISDQKQAHVEMQHHLHQMLQESIGAAPFVEETIAQKCADPFGGALYAAFEERFRGSREDIKQRQQVYLPLIAQCQAGTPDAPVLDIGCGRGEWLELLKEQQWIATGIDSNRIFVHQCIDKGLSVVEQDALAYLRSLPDHTLGAITAFQVIEHLPIKVFIALLDESLRVLRTGGLVIFETPNPANMIVGSCDFYLDPTHQHPLPAPLSQYLLEAQGFVRAHIVELHPFDTAHRFTEGSPEMVQYLNQRFFGPRDYAVIAYKV